LDDITGNIVIDEDLEKHLNPGKSLFIVTVLGKQKSGKSTTMNEMFNTGFLTGENMNVRTTEGVIGCLVNNPDNDLLLLDSEGTRSV
jgi:GTPase Era involved in 16S rRNA processing